MEKENLINLREATTIVESLSQYESFQAKKILSLVTLSFGLKLVPVNAQVTLSQTSATEKSVRKSAAPTTVSAPGKKIPKKQKPTFDKSNREWLELQKELSELSTQIRELPAEEKESAKADDLRKNRKLLASKSKVLRKKLQASLQREEDDNDKSEHPEWGGGPEDGTVGD